MAGPTTEVLNDDIKSLRDETHRIDLDVRELSTKVNGVTSGIRLLGVFTLASLLSSVWWGASLTTKGDGLGSRLDKLEAKVDARFDKIDAQFKEIDAQFKEIDGRFDRLEASIARLIEQTKPAARP